MSPTLTGAERDELQIKLIAVTPRTSISPEQLGDASVFCFNIDDGIDNLVEWVKSFRYMKAENPQLVVPCFIAIGHTTQYDFRGSYSLKRYLSSMGAAFFEWPEECGTFTEVLEKLGEEAGEIYKMFHYDEEGSFLAKATAELGRRRKNLQITSTPAESAEVLSVYADPPVQLSDEDFSSLIKRMDGQEDLSDPED
jgi:hypothetical protein